MTETGLPLRVTISGSGMIAFMACRLSLFTPSRKASKGAHRARGVILPHHRSPRLDRLPNQSGETRASHPGGTSNRANRVRASPAHASNTHASMRNGSAWRTSAMARPQRGTYLGVRQHGATPIGIDREEE